MSDDWKAKANCKGLAPELFFPERNEHEKVRQALAVCRGCVVRDECLEENLGEQFGIWGGTSGKQRVALRRQRKQTSTPPRDRQIQAHALRTHGFSVEEAANELGVHPETIVKWTKGQHYPRVPTERQPKPWCYHCDLEKAWTSEGLCRACDTYHRKYERLPSFGVIVERNRRRDERRSA